jgi:hypothetical protein
LQKGYCILQKDNVDALNAPNLLSKEKQPPAPKVPKLTTSINWLHNECIINRNIKPVTNKIK